MDLKEELIKRLKLLLLTCKTSKVVGSDSEKIKQIASISQIMTK
jgi:hypothetical protein